MSVGASLELMERSRWQLRRHAPLRVSDTMKPHVNTAREFGENCRCLVSTDEDRPSIENYTTSFSFSLSAATAYRIALPLRPAKPVEFLYCQSKTRRWVNCS